MEVLGIIGSSGGSALAAAAKCIAASGEKQSWSVLTDRKCGLAEWATDNADSLAFVDYQSPESFSEQALRYFRRQGVRHVLLFYTRIVADPLISELQVYNVHPSLLPAYPGIGAVRRAFGDGATSIGATLHHVNAELDKGEIITSIESPLPKDCTLATAEKLSFLQKTRLTLVWRQLTSDPRTSSRGVLPPRLHASFRALEQSEDLSISPEASRFK